ncbi:hypothetical protein QR680_003544 [Steinernema hermaphroditum]|uniref:Lsm14-like N-terminal domain-containing protein n=1 Tax=Steinernema hermaphroditum TaxID=289476 RepID=A0AA39HKR4_9BILA|nr:hypothetical protein QR680_003544 [Steinernema hermaphroditum]
MEQPYIGSQISLISQLDIRYEGILYSVDTVGATITFAKVRSFGTEDRRSVKPIPARDELYEYIIFKAGDIKDLVVVEELSHGIMEDPAIIKASQDPLPPIQRAAVDAGIEYYNTRFDGMSSQTRTQPGDIKPIGDRRKKHVPTFSEIAKSGISDDSEIVQGHQTRHHSYNDRQAHSGTDPATSRHPGFEQRHAGRQKHFDSEFDFEKAENEFQNVIAGMTGSMGNMNLHHYGTKEDPKVADKSEIEECYNKAVSFFDEISCEARDKEEGKIVRVPRNKERLVNQETFGVEAVSELSMIYRGARHYRGRLRGGYRHGYRRDGWRSFNNNFERQAL